MARVALAVLTLLLLEARRATSRRSVADQQEAAAALGASDGGAAVDDDVAWLDNMEFGCRDSSRQGCPFRRFPGWNALYADLGGHPIVDQFRATPGRTKSEWDVAYARRYFYVKREEECAALCCGLREHCNVYVFQAVSLVRNVCVYFSFPEDSFAPAKLQGASVMLSAWRLCRFFV
jgi:hypothetical protein